MVILENLWSFRSGDKEVCTGERGDFFKRDGSVNTMVTKREIKGDGFSYISEDFYETQAIRLGYSYKF